MRVFLKGLSLLCMCAVLMGSARLSFADEYLQVEARFTEREGYSGIKQVPGMGEMRYYAQNDPLWALLCYEKNNVPKRRPFRDSGCNPTALAMAIAYLVPERIQSFWDLLWGHGAKHLYEESFSVRIRRNVSWFH